MEISPVFGKGVLILVIYKNSFFKLADGLSSKLIENHKSQEVLRSVLKTHASRLFERGVFKGRVDNVPLCPDGSKIKHKHLRSRSARNCECRFL